MGGEGTIERRVEQLLSRAMPEVDLLEIVVAGAPGGGMLKLVIDHPGGVDHDLCAAVTHELDRGGFLEEFGAEVSSPGPEPPLRRPDHFRRAVGRRVRVRAETADGRRSHTGTLTEADDVGLRITSGDEVVEIPYSAIRRARALEDQGAGR